MKELYSRFVEEVRKGSTPEQAAVAVGVSESKGPRWMGKQDIKDALAETKRPRRAVRHRAVRSKRKK